jgi:PAS domain S-box-containing protein
VNFFEDVGERNRASQATGLLAAIVDSSDDAIVSKNLDGVITSWNQGAARLFGYTAEEAVGRHITLIVPQDRLHEEATILARLRRGERVDHFETVRVHKDGTMLDLSLTISPVKDADGRVVGASKVARDISDRKRWERVQSEQARLLDLSSDAILVRDAGDRVTFWNHAASELYGFSPEEALGRVTHELLRTEFPEPLESIRKQLLQRDRWTGELVHTAKNGKQIVVASRWVIDRDEHDDVRTVLETNSDVTEHKHAEEARKESELSARLLQLQDDERRRIARELHDSVGQLLAAMGMNVSRIAREKANLSPEAARCAEEISHLVEQLSNDIRTVSYLLHPPLLDEMGLQSALKWYVDGFADRSKIVAKLEVPTDVERMPQDHELCLFRVAQEGLTNIHRHSGSSTALIKLFRTPGKITLEVADSGRGVSHETQRKIASGESAGVGLRGMRERIRQLGGTLEIHANDKGTTVIATLPHAEAAP